MDYYFNPYVGFGLLPTKKRKAYFAFHYDDIMRVNNVRNAWKIDHPDSPQNRSFQDSSLWESRMLEKDDSLKRLIREGVQYTSAVCVLVGTHTWSRRWVRYEIARAVIDGRGLLAVHLNNINHHQTWLPDPLGINPLRQLAVGKVQLYPWEIAQYYLYEYQNTANGWIRYQDHTDPVSLPPYLTDPATGYVTFLSSGTSIYDFAQPNAARQLGSWIDKAAQAVGR